MPFFVHRVVGQETQLQRVRGDTLLIGRGTGADLRFPDDAAVDLEHALIRQDEKGFLLVDQGSVTGSYVNGRAVATARLSDEDRIEIGGHEMRVQIAHRDDPLFLHVKPLGPEEATEASTQRLPLDALRTPAAAPVAPTPVTDYAAAYGLGRRGVGKRGLSAAALAAAGALVLLAFAGSSAATRPGTVSTAHATVGLETHCSACHVPWKGVASERCESCHAGPRHQPMQAFDPPCGECHSEHRGQAELTRVSDRDCLACHRDLTLAGGGTPRVARRIASFADHPDFQPVADPDTLRLDHALHLKPGLRGPEGPQQLACADCHAYDAESGDIRPVTFAAHCQGCHDLYFDDRFPDLAAPHGDPEAVRLAVLGAYTGAREALRGLSDAEQRRLIFSGRGGGFEVSERVRRQAFTALDQLFRHRCTLCHEMTVASATAVTVTAPVIPERWLPGVDFSHKPHRALACEDCHGAAAASRATADVLVPGIDACSRCHARQAAVALACADCHLYHEKSATGWEATLAAAPPGAAARGEGR